MYAHPLFLEQLDELAFDLIPEDPTRPEYRLGDTLGAERKHWFRAKFFQQYRLFFRFSSKEKVIVLAWVNGERSKRAYGAKRDAYRTFRKMLDADDPPDDWDALMREAQRATRRAEGRGDDPDA